MLPTKWKQICIYIMKDIHVAAKSCVHFKWTYLA